MTDQPSLFDVSVRRSDPASSHRAVQAIARNGTIKDLIIRAVVALDEEDEWPVTDDQILNYVEAASAVRQQRNVIARSRGLLERDGWFDRVEDPLANPGDKLSFTPTQKAIDHVRNQP